MGRLIDCNDVYNAIQITTDNFGVAKRVVEANMLTMLSKIETVEAIPKADYVNRLKADMVAMLTELQLEIEELDLEDAIPEYEDGAKNTREYITNILEEKINALKGKGKQWE